MPTEFDQVLDNSGLACPMPIIKTKKAMDGLASGAVLKMIATDAGSVADVEAWTEQTGNVLLEHEEGDGIFTFYIRKKD